METLSGWFGELVFTGAPQGTPAAITVIGTGGKTSLLWLLARSLAQGGRKILVTPTTKMFLPAAEPKPYHRFCNGTPPAPLPGVTLAGKYSQKSGKLESLAPPELERAAASCDVTLIEGDGSREHPLKGWAEHEPLVPDFTTITVGIIPLWPLARPASAEIIHRLPLFCALSGAEPGEPLKAKHIAAAICGCRAQGTAAPEKSLFSAAKGKKVLFFNQIEDKAAAAHAQEVVSLLPPVFCSGLDRIIAGSVQQNLIWQMFP